MSRGPTIERWYQYFKARQGRVITKGELSMTMYGRPDADANIFDKIRRLRMTLAAGETVLPIWGRGYIFLEAGMTLTPEMIAAWNDDESDVPPALEEARVGT